MNQLPETRSSGCSQTPSGSAEGKMNSNVIMRGVASNEDDDKDDCASLQTISLPVFYLLKSAFDNQSHHNINLQQEVRASFMSYSYWRVLGGAH